VLQRIVGQTETASSDAWKSLIDEVTMTLKPFFDENIFF
jgi:hypothetical protein